MSYAIVITDESEHIATVHTFEQKELWDWLHAPEVFPYSATSITTTMPVKPERQVSVTIGSTDNDKAHHIVNAIEPWAEENPVVVRLNAYDKTVQELREQLGEDRVYEGLSY